MNMVLLTLSAIPLLAWELYFIVFAVVGAWAASDARDRGMKAGAQASVFVSILLFGIIGLIVWFMVRPGKGSGKASKKRKDSGFDEKRGRVAMPVVCFLLLLSFWSLWYLSFAHEEVQAGRPTGSAQQQGQARLNTPTELQLAVGQTATTPALQVTVHAVNRTKEYTYAYDYYPYYTDRRAVAPEGKVYLILDAEVNNLGNDFTYSNPSEFSVTDSRGYRYDRTWYVGDGEFPSQKLYKGQRARGKILFEIPRTAVGLKVVYDFGDPFSGVRLVSWRIPDTTTRASNQTDDSVYMLKNIGEFLGRRITVTGEPQSLTATHVPDDAAYSILYQTGVTQAMRAAEDEGGKAYFLPVNYSEFYCTLCEVKGIVRRIETCSCEQNSSCGAVRYTTTVQSCTGAAPSCANYRSACVESTRRFTYYLDVTEVRTGIA